MTKFWITAGLCVLLVACSKDPPSSPAALTATVTAGAAPPAPAKSTAKIGVVATRPDAPAILNMDSIGDLSKSENFQGQLRGGTRIEDPTLYPASVYASLGYEICTATLVGPNTLLTAGHCARTGTVAKFVVKAEARTATCTRDSHYRPDLTADYTLCLVYGPPITSVPLEWVNTDPSVLKIDMPLLLTGFGCTNSDGTGGGDRTYVVGTNDKIVGLPRGANNEIVTSGSTAVCMGDSGGPAFLVNGSKRWLVSVNSSAGQVGEVLNDRSYLESTSTPEAVAFLTTWTQTNKQSICGLPPGVSSGSAKCR